MRLAALRLWALGESAIGSRAESLLWTLTRNEADRPEKFHVELSLDGKASSFE